MEDDEVDMLDLAFEVTETSRLGCQIKVRKDMDGMMVRAPGLLRRPTLEFNLVSCLSNLCKSIGPYPRRWLLILQVTVVNHRSLS
jgi:hypothetical protein